MIRFFTILCVISLFIPTTVFAQDTKDDILADSVIKSVTVYTDRAKITRVAVVEVPAGAHVVVFKNLPAMLLPDSLRAEGKAKAGVKFGAVSHKQVMSAQLASEREKGLNDQLEDLQSQVASIAAEKAAIAAKQSFIRSLGQQATLRSNENIAQIDLKPDQWSAAAQTIYTDLSDASKTDIQLDLKLRNLNRDIAKVQGDIAMLRTDQRSTYSVIVPLEADSATQLTIELSYQVPNATWMPLYDARLSSEEKDSLTLTQYGSVSQNTGEDWNGVALTLSTAQPQRGASLPDLQPMWVDAYAPNVGVNLAAAVSAPMASRQMMAQNIVSSNDLSMDKAESDGAMAPAMEKKATFTTAQINTGGFVSEYKIPGPSTVPADGTETKLMIGDFAMASSLEIHIKPQLSREAFLVAKSKLKGDSPILPGQVNLFRDGAYVGQSALKLLRPDEETDFYFGVDDQVSVKRKILKDEKKEQGVITRDSVLERHYSTEIQNLHKTAIRVVVKETTPAPRNEAVRLELVKQATTEGYKDNSDNIKGMLYWEFPMEPKSKKEVRLGWILTWPKDQQISGVQ